VLKKEKTKKYLPVEEVGIRVEDIDEAYLEELASKASEFLNDLLNRIIGKQDHFISTVGIELNRERNTIDVVIDVELFSSVEVSPQIITEVDNVISRCFEVIKDELIRKFKNRY